jgi:hypothetical protein
MENLSIQKINIQGDICKIIYQGNLLSADRIDISRYIKESNKHITLVIFEKNMGEN